MSGASEKAVQAVSRFTHEAWTKEDAFGEADARDVLDAAHDPALGLDRSICLRDAVEVFKRLTRDPLNPPEPDDFEREFGGGS